MTSKFIKIILPVVAIVFLVAGYLYLAGKTKLNNEPVEVEEITETTQENETAETETAEWKTYKNEEYGFEFKYPDDWYYGGGPRGDNQFLICLNPKGMAGDCAGKITINWNTDFGEHYNATKKIFEKYDITESETTISNVSAKMFTVSGYEKGREGFTRELFFEHNGFVYNIAIIYGKEDIFDHILSTFKFTE